MSNIYKLSGQERRYDEASLWISKLDRGLSADEQKALQQWLSDSQENKELFLKMAEMWGKMDVLSRLADLFPQPVRRQSESKWFFPAMAASISIVMLSAWWGLTNLVLPGDEVDLAISNVYKTAVGEYSTVELPDGSQIVLNTNTLVRVNYTDQQRILELERGEVHVDVAHDATRALSVVAGGQVVQAVGTAFNIELHSDQRIELVVTEGKVLVGVHNRAPENTNVLQPITILPRSSIAVSAGQQLVTGAPDEKVKAIEPSEIDIKLSWRNGNLIFQGESLEDAIAEISRYTSVEFVFLDENLKKVRVAGLFKAGDVSGLLTTLRENFNISYQRLEEKVLLGDH